MLHNQSNSNSLKNFHVHCLFIVLIQIFLDLLSKIQSFHFRVPLQFIALVRMYEGDQVPYDGGNGREEHQGPDDHAVVFGHRLGVQVTSCIGGVVVALDHL